jgi:hypothetical protein
MDELEQQIRDANPVPVRRDTPLSERAERDLALILSEDGPTVESTPRRARHWWPLWVPAAAALLALLTVVLLPHPPTAVASPPLLRPAPLNESLQQVVTQLSQKARAEVAPQLGSVSYDAWSASVEVDADHPKVFVQPTLIERRFSVEDGSGSVRMTAGEIAYGSPTDASPATPAGTVLEEYEYGPGEYPLLYQEPLPDDAVEVPAYFERAVGQPLDSTAGDYFKLVQDFGTEHIVAGPDAATLLTFLAQLDDVTVLGDVADRLGRDGVALSTSTRADGAFQDILIFSRDDGRLLTAEEVYLGGLDGLDIDYPTVFNYISWRDHA